MKGCEELDYKERVLRCDGRVTGRRRRRLPRRSAGNLDKSSYTYIVTIIIVSMIFTE